MVWQLTSLRGALGSEWLQEPQRMLSPNSLFNVSGLPTFNRTTDARADEAGRSSETESRNRHFCNKLPSLYFTSLVLRVLCAL